MKLWRKTEIRTVLCTKGRSMLRTVLPRLDKVGAAPPHPPPLLFLARAHQRSFIREADSVHMLTTMHGKLRHWVHCTQAIYLRLGQGIN